MAYDKKMLMKKKEDKPAMDPMVKDAKIHALSGFHDIAKQAMSDKLKSGLTSKVEVIGKSPSDLKSGLDKAKELLKGHLLEGSQDEEAGESPEEENQEVESGLEGSEEDQPEEGSEESESEDSSVQKLESEAEALSEDELDSLLEKLKKIKEQKALS